MWSRIWLNCASILVRIRPFRQSPHSICENFKWRTWWEGRWKNKHFSCFNGTFATWRATFKAILNKEATIFHRIISWAPAIISVCPFISSLIKMRLILLVYFHFPLSNFKYLLDLLLTCFIFNENIRRWVCSPSSELSSLLKKVNFIFSLGAKCLKRICVT
jgi:hypothetical protein